MTVVLLFSCGKNFDAKQSLSQKQYDTLLAKLAPYVIKKPDELTYENRFAKESQPYYAHIVNHTGGELRYFLHRDSADFFFYCSRDRSSLFEHYRGLGGYYKLEGNRIVFLNLLYHTPRLTKEEMTERGSKLFETMVTKGNVDEFFGDRKYIHTPNADFYYNTTLNRWDYTDNSSWKFMQDAKAKAE